MVGGRVGNDYTLIEQRQMNLSKAILMVNVNERQGLHGLCRLYVLRDGEGLARWGRWSSSVRRTPELRAGASTGTVDFVEVFAGEGELSVALARAGLARPSGGPGAHLRPRPQEPLRKN